jgi:hypothetical protein
MSQPGENGELPANPFANPALWSWPFSQAAQTVADDASPDDAPPDDNPSGTARTGARANSTKSSKK